VTKLPSTTVLLKLVKGRIGVLVQSVHQDRKLGAVSRRSPSASNMGSNKKPTGTNSIQPSIPPPKERLRRTRSEKMTRLWRFISGVSPSADPRAIPAATCPGVPAECKVLMMDWMSLSNANMAGKLEELGAGS
jgi:hypothetical protein